MRAQATTSGFESLEISGITVSGSLRVRVESWDRFGNNPGGRYTYAGSLFRFGLSHTQKAREWQVEFSRPMVLGLPQQPAGAGPQGLGANYFTANGGSTNAAMLFAKQAFVRFKDFGAIDGQSLKVGRMEFFDGAEVSPKNATLATVKRDRVASRLLANFGFTHVQRSLDGVQYAIDRPRLHVTVLAARPTGGVFQVDGWKELDVNVFYGAVTGQLGNAADAGEWRLFGLGYNDRRDGVVKTDNRPLAARESDSSKTARTGRDHGSRDPGGRVVCSERVIKLEEQARVWRASAVGVYRLWRDLGHAIGAVLAGITADMLGLAAAMWLVAAFDYSSERKVNVSSSARLKKVLTE